MLFFTGNSLLTHTNRVYSKIIERKPSIKVVQNTILIAMNYLEDKICTRRLLPFFLFFLPRCKYIILSIFFSEMLRVEVRVKSKLFPSLNALPPFGKSHHLKHLNMSELWTLICQNKNTVWYTIILLVHIMIVPHKHSESIEWSVLSCWIKANSKSNPSSMLYKEWFGFWSINIFGVILLETFFLCNLKFLHVSYDI